LIIAENIGMQLLCHALQVQEFLCVVLSLVTKL
jgi:hypothetical protein